ncbi:MAG TPA: UDP-N-acetylmuramate--L-alanine ligase [Trueperaceae bacterium]|nr:UDP-N-acetylmuramate--L-alanine ligase [Trueperaceae bacterium]
MTDLDTGTARGGAGQRIHFMGIGGVSMAALARWCFEEGFEVSGCDASGSPVLGELAALGIRTCAGHDASHAEDVDVVVHSMAVPYDHPELAAARAHGRKVLRRIALLGELFTRRSAVAVTGSHGKSTTTAMVGTLLLALDRETSIQLGASLPSIGGSMRYGRGEWLAAEVDESDPGFADLVSKVAVITNLDDDHIAGEYDERRNYHASFEDLQAAAQRFTLAAERLVYCADWPGLRDLVGGHPRAVNYGTGALCDYRIGPVELTSGGSRFEVTSPDLGTFQVELSVPGMHNVLNATAALAATHVAGFDPRLALGALKDFTGVGRRLQSYGALNGASIVDDYAVHPTEVAVTLQVARATGLRVRAVLQPHRWVRTARQWPALAKAAALADEVVVLGVYAAGERPIEGVSPELIAERVRSLGVKARVTDLAGAEEYLAATAAPGEMLVMLGAGDVWRVAAGLAARAKAAGSSETSPAGAANPWR